MVDPIFEHPRLVAIYDALDPDRADLDVYVRIAQELGARRVLDIGCGTGTFALMLQARGLDVIGCDPAGGSLAVARAKSGGDTVRWIDGDVAGLADVEVDLATMTGNVAQAIADPDDWQMTLERARELLRPGGHLVFETRDSRARGWEEWTRDASHRITHIPEVGSVESWVDLVEVALPLVRFRATWVFASDGEVLTSDSTLRFRDRAEIEDALHAAGYVVDEIRDTPDRPGRELVFIAHRSD